MSGRRAAELAGMSEGRWRQIAKGYMAAGGGHAIPVIAPADTLARMALAVGVTADELRKAGREDAADVLTMLIGMEAEGEWQRGRTVLDRLIGLPNELDGVIAELGNTERGTPPAVQLIRPDE